MSQPKENEVFSVTLRPLERDDFHRLVRWTNAPHVARWWDGTVDIDKIIARYEPRLSDNPPARVYIIEADGHPVGMIQCYRNVDFPDWDNAIGIARAAGIDYMIGETSYLAKNIGSKAIAMIVEIAFDSYKDVEVIVVAPQRDNRASWRILEKAGFRRIDERKLEIDSSAQAGISYIYALKRTAKTKSAANFDN